MQLLVDQFEQFSGAVLQPASAPLTDAQFFALCARYPDYRIETTAEGDIHIMPPARPRTGQRNAAITYHLLAWTECLLGPSRTGEARLSTPVPDSS